MFRLGRVVVRSRSPGMASHRSRGPAGREAHLGRVARRTKGDRLRSRPADEPTRQAAFWATCHLLDESRHHPATLKRHRLDATRVESGFE